MSGGPALYDVGDIDLSPVDTDLVGQQRVEEATGPAYERESVAVLVAARGLAHDHERGIRVTGPEDHLGAGGRQRAPRAGGRLVCEHGELIESGTGGHRRMVPPAPVGRPERPVVAPRRQSGRLLPGWLSTDVENAGHQVGQITGHQARAVPERPSPPVHMGSQGGGFEGGNPSSEEGGDHSGQDVTSTG